MEHIRLGTPTTIYLLKSVNAQFLASSRHLWRVRSADVLLGLGVLGVGLAWIGETVSFVEAALFVVALFCALLLSLVTLTFWFVANRAQELHGRERVSRQSTHTVFTFTNSRIPGVESSRP